MLPLSLQGLGASILGAIPYTAIRLGSYDGLKYAYKKVPSLAPAPHITRARRLHSKSVCLISLMQHCRYQSWSASLKVQ